MAILLASAEAAFEIYLGEKTSNERKAFIRVRFTFLNLTNALRPVATAKTASDIPTRKRGS
jgi:hypothetical protein